MKQELWLSRDDTTLGDYNISIGKPILCDDGKYRGFIAFFRTRKFHQIFSIRLRKGRKKRIKRILIELED